MGIRKLIDNYNWILFHVTMPIQQTTKRLVRYHYKKFIPIDCELVHVHRAPPHFPHQYWLWRGCQLLRPVFDMSREKKAYEIRKYMTTIAKISAAQSREYLYKQELMKLHNGVLPEDIVCLIAQYTWDIMLLLK